MKKKLISLLLCLSLLLALPFSGAQAALEDGWTSSNGLNVRKTATANTDGSYTIKLEAFATGSQVTTTVTEEVPTDIILVLDQSGSMQYGFDAAQYIKYTTTTNKDNYGRRHNNGSENLWYLKDGKYYSVSVTSTQGFTALENLANYKSRNGQLTDDCYWYYANNLYEKIDDEYVKVTVTQFFSLLALLDGARGYVYSLSNDTVVSRGNSTHPNFGERKLYTPTPAGADTVYTYTYTDDDGIIQTIGSSTGADTTFTPEFYQRVGAAAGTTRLDALKTAVTAFANNVAEKAAGPDGVNHRIAVVGFACGQRYGGENYNYRNTELFVGSEQYRYGNAAQGKYASAFQDMSTDDGKGNVSASIGALTADGGTLTNYGLEMANGIFAANPIQSGENRNRVVILFTDGVPGWSGYEEGVATAAITQAGIAKNTHGATVYTVGIFEGADASEAGAQGNGDDARANRFMQSVSSNNGTPQYPSYYLSASNAGALSSIFQQISNQIQTGGSSTTLNSQAVVKDIIAPSFMLPEGATAGNVQINIYACTGKNGETYTFGTTSAGNGGATATVDNNQVSVTGFNFSENWCGTDTVNGQSSARGNKLEISFTVQPKPGFLGGNSVPTNASAGIYENANAQNPVVEFPVPYVDVPIPELSVTATDKNVYLLQDVYSTALIGDTTFQAGEHVTLNLTETNYGLEDWQYQYVNINIGVADQAGDAIVEKLDGLTADSSYKVTLTISPKSVGTVSAKSGEDTAAINVFKPELTFKDSSVYYGDTAPTLSGNLLDTKWKHQDPTSEQVTEANNMIGNAPELTLVYTPEDGKIANGRINTKQDIGVDVTVSIGGADATSVTGHTTFVHQNCEGKTCTLPDGKKFLLHVNTCQLTITKTGGAEGEPYVFTVYKSVEGPESEAHPYTYVTITGNGSATIYELPVGRYEITEDTAWSWRYTSGISPMSVTLTSGNSTGELTCNNTLAKEYWLNGYSTVVPNTYGGSGNATTAGGAG